MTVKANGGMEYSIGWRSTRLSISKLSAQAFVVPVLIVYCVRIVFLGGLSAQNEVKTD